MKTAAITVEQILAEQLRLANRSDPDAGGMSTQELSKKLGKTHAKVRQMLKADIIAGKLECRMCLIFDIAGRPTRIPKYFAVQKKG